MAKLIRDIECREQLLKECEAKLNCEAWKEIESFVGKYPCTADWHVRYYQGTHFWILILPSG